MNLLLVGVNHRSAPLEVRERLAALAVGAVLEGLRGDGWTEAVVLSTCNRFEVYAVAPEPGGALERLQKHIEALAGQPLDGKAYLRSGPGVAGHLFSVASSLDSLVVGEGEILGQVKTAYEAARRAGMTGKLTNVMFQRAAFVGKEIRNATGIARGPTSVASIAVRLAERIFGDLSSVEVLVMGAGPMAEKAAAHLLGRRVSRMYVANRTWERAESLAARFRGRALAWHRIPDVLKEVDIVIASTGSDRPVLPYAMVEGAMRFRRGRSLFLVDIAMPRDVDESVHSLEHVYLYTLEDFDAIVQESLGSRRGEVDKARRLVRDLAEEFSHWLHAQAAGGRVPLKHGAGARGSCP